MLRKIFERFKKVLLDIDFTHELMMYRFIKRKLLIYYSEDHEKIGYADKQIIYMADGKMIHGGLADRLRGMTTIYRYCVENNIKFKINHTTPFNLYNFLVPNSYNWQINKTELSYNSTESKPVYVESYGESEIKDKKFQKYMLKKQLSGNFKQYHIYTNANFKDDFFSVSFNELFKPSKILQKAIDFNLKELGSSYISLVFRFQQLLGDFKEGCFPILSQQDQKELIDRCILKVVDFKSDESKILITSDSISFLNEVTKLPYVYVIPGKIAHMDYSQNEDEELYMKSYIDFFMLSKSKKIFLVRTSYMFRSGFALRAAMVNNIPYREIII